MAVMFPSTAAGGERWSRRASAASPDYKAGITAASGKWQPAAVAAEANYSAGVTQAAAKKSFSAGVQKAGDAKWVQRATAVGPGRFAEGVTVAQPSWEAGVAPVWAKASAAVLPPRGPRRAETNYQRSVQMAKAFAQAAG
jgi:hypothetical protein